MGAPRKNRRKYEKPKDIWNLGRINTDNALIKEFALKNMKELWKVQSNISRIRGNVRELLSGNAKNPEVEKNIISSIAKLGIVTGDSTLDNLLEINENAFLERRLQSLVYRKGMARSMRQSRQIIVHGFISINSRRVSRPGYMVSKAEETQISYYKPIDVNVNVAKEPNKRVEAKEPAAVVAGAQAQQAEQSGADAANKEVQG